MKYFIVTLALLLAGCTTISTNPVAVPAGSFVGKDLIAAAYNLDQAVAIGALKADDPAPKCVHGVLMQAGIEVPPGTPAPGSFTPQKEGLVSIGSIAYIKAQQLKGAKLTVPQDCKALIGQLVIDGLTAPATVVAPLVK